MLILPCGIGGGEYGFVARQDAGRCYRGRAPDGAQTRRSRELQPRDPPPVLAGTRPGAPARLPNRPGLLGTLGVQPEPGLAQPATAALLGRELPRQLITTRITELLILFTIDAPGVLENLPCDLLVITRRLTTRVRVDPRLIDRDHPDLRQAGLCAEPQHLTEQARQHRLVALAKTRDRRVIRALVRRDHPVGDILDTLTLDHPRGTLPHRIGVEQQRDHHPRIVRRAPP